ncbi:uncharacterized protein LOC117297840 [Asterias rubens]|uniref:uncharacterized protein LOC117297840 n=1 Tax=Asterias rubens TaxID=7604 RepID=UPI00145532EA|nr:uncharacterized protein LOC117297840 [Asterias rubens]
MFGCFTLSIAAVFCMTLFTSFPGQVSSAKDSPEPEHLYIEAGSELHLNCTVNDAVKTGNLTAEDIVWHRSSSPLPSSLYSAVTDTLSQLSFNVTFDDSGDYSCVLPGNITGEPATYVVHVGHSPEPEHLYIEAGSELHLNCTVNDAVKTGNLTAEDIVWHRSSSPLPSSLYSAVTDTLSQLSFNVTFDDSGDYSCVLPGNITGEPATYVVHVGLKPRPVRLECIVRKPDDFYWCRWRETENTHLPTVHTFQFRKKRRPWQDCPDLISKGNNTCYIRQTDNQGGNQIVRVKSTNGLGENSSWTSFWSNQDVVVNPPKLVALKPGTEKTSLKVQWTRPSDWFATEASRSLEYTIRFKEIDCVEINNTCCCWDEVETTHAEAYSEELGRCMYTLRNLHPYTEYIVQVAARYEYSNYWSVWTAEDSSVTRETEPSEPVQGLKVNQTDNAEEPLYLRDISVTWEFLEAEAQNGLILDYQVSAEPREGADDIGIHKLVSNYTTCIIRGLRKYSSYEIHVRARNSAGMGPDATKSIADRTTAPNAPDDVTAVPLNTTDILVKWEEPSQPNGYILGYIIQWRKRNTNGPIEQYNIYNASKRSYVLEGLETYALYEVSVKANNSRGSGGAAFVPGGARTMQGVPNAAPSSVKLKPVSNLPDSLMLTWESLPVANIQGVLKGYSILYCKTNISGCSGKIVQRYNLTRPDKTSHTLNKLTPTTNYTVSVAAYTEVNIGPFSDKVTAVTGAKGLGIYLPAFFLLLALLLASVAVACCIWKNFDRLFRKIPVPKFSKNVHAFKHRTDINLRRINSGVEEEQFDEIAIEVTPGRLQSVNELTLPDLKKFVRTESGDSGVPPSPASDTLDFDVIRDKSGVTSEGEDSVFLGEDQDDKAMVPSLPLTVRIGRVEEGATRHFPRGATSPSSPESVGSYTRVGEFQFSIKKSCSPGTEGFTRKVSFDLPDVGPELTITEKPSTGDEYKTQSCMLTTPIGYPLEASPSIDPQKPTIGPLQLTGPAIDSIVLRRSLPFKNPEASFNQTPSLPPTSTSPVSPYMTAFETQIFLYPCENGNSRHHVRSMGSVIDASKRPSTSMSPTPLSCLKSQHSDQKDTSKTQEQFSGSASDCGASLNPTPRLALCSSSSETQTCQPVSHSGYTHMSATRDPRQQNSSTSEESQAGLADSDRITQLVQPSQCSALVKLEGSKPSSYSQFPPVFSINKQLDTFEGTDTMADIDGFKEAPKSRLSLSADQHNPCRSTSTTHSSSSSLEYVKMESLETVQQKHHSELRRTMVPAQSSKATSKQHHLINSSYIDVASSEHPGRDREEEAPDDSETHKPISKKTATSNLGDKTEITTTSGGVLTPSGYVQASFTRFNLPTSSIHQLAGNQSNTPINAPILPPGSTSDPEDDVQEYWKVSAPVTEPGDVLALLQAHSNTNNFSSDSVVADYTRTGRGTTTSLSRAQTSMGYVQ